MRAPPGGCRVAESVGYQNPGQADGIADYDQGDNYTHGYRLHGHAHRHGLEHHGHADTHAHDGDAYINVNADADPGSRRHGG
jgi:hypothetical protein